MGDEGGGGGGDTPATQERVLIILFRPWSADKVAGFSIKFADNCI